MLAFKTGSVTILRLGRGQEASRETRLDAHSEWAELFNISHSGTQFCNSYQKKKKTLSFNLSLAVFDF